MGLWNLGHQIAIRLDVGNLAEIHTEAVGNKY
jgi:hypothetical protein